MNHRFLPLAFLLLFGLVPAHRPALADPPIPSEVWVTCKPVETMLFPGNRFHVLCEQGWTNPSTLQKYPYFAISAANNAHVEQAMSMAHTAQISGKKLRLRIKTGSSSNPAGCLTSDCRAFIGIGVVN